MTQADEIKVGDTVWYGVNTPEKVKVLGRPKLVSGRWLVLVQRADGACDEVMLTFIRVQKKRPSARRGREVRAPLKAVVDCYNEMLPEEDRLTPELLEDRMKRWGMGK